VRFDPNDTGSNLKQRVRGSGQNRESLMGVERHGSNDCANPNQEIDPSNLKTAVTTG
jgi:hypothetical protein